MNLFHSGIFFNDPDLLLDTIADKVYKDRLLAFGYDFLLSP